jgi:hypothetical protein
MGAFHPDLVAGMLRNALIAPAADCGPCRVQAVLATWSMSRAAADVGGVAGPVSARDLLPLDRRLDVDA